MVTGPTIDPERMAALLDGRVDAREREALMAELAASGEDLEVFADAVAVMGETGGAVADAPPDAGVIPLHPRRAAVWRWLPAVAAAAVLVMLAPWLADRLRSDAPVDPARLALLLERADAGLPEGWNRHPWTATRGAGDPLTGETRAVRLGAHLLTLELAARAGDPEAGQIAAEVGALLDDVAGGGPAAAVYRQVAREVDEGRAPEPALLRDGWEAASALVDAQMLGVGAWLEAARVAAAGRDAAFFRADDSRRALDRVEARLRAEGMEPAEAQRVRRALLETDPPEWSALEFELTVALARLAG
jgi:hypothetical protein